MTERKEILLTSKINVDGERLSSVEFNFYGGFQLTMIYSNLHCYDEKMWKDMPDGQRVGDMDNYIQRIGDITVFKLDKTRMIVSNSVCQRAFNRIAKRVATITK